MSQKNELGKGLKALLSNINKEDKKSKPEPSTPEEPMVSSVALIPLHQIIANPDQPRNTFEKESLDDLALSIKTYGLIQPITIRSFGTNQYQIISGERRFRAAQLEGLKEIPAYIRSANDLEVLQMALVENIQREDLSPIEIAISYQRLMEECNLTQEQLSDRVGKKRSTISNYTRLLKLPPEVQNSLKAKTLSMGHARVIAGVEDLLLQTQLYKEIQTKELSVRESEKIAQSYIKSKGRRSITPKSDPNIMIKSIEDRISGILGTKVIINRKSTGEGQIIIKFNNDKAFNDIIDRIEE